MQTLKMKQKILGKRNNSGKFKLGHNQMKLRDLSKERREEETKTQEPSTSYAEAASN